MPNNHSDFVKTLQQRARHQSKLHTVQFIPAPLRPIMALVAEYPWQSLLALSFIVAWMVFLIWFEFFYAVVHNIV